VEDGGLGSSIQEVLDAAELHSELIFFKDIKGSVWQIIKRDETDLAILSERKHTDNEDSIIDPETLDIGVAASEEDLPLP